MVLLSLTRSSLILHHLSFLFFLRGENFDESGRDGSMMVGAFAEAREVLVGIGIEGMEEVADDGDSSAPSRVEETGSDNFDDMDEFDGESRVGDEMLESGIKRIPLLFAWPFPPIPKADNLGLGIALRFGVGVPL